VESAESDKKERALEKKVLNQTRNNLPQSSLLRQSMAGCSAIDRHEGGRGGRGAYRRHRQEGRQLRDRRQARRQLTLGRGRQFLRADSADRCDDRHGHHQGGDLWPGRAAPPFKTDAEAINMTNDTAHPYFRTQLKFSIRTFKRSFGNPRISRDSSSVISPSATLYALTYFARS
jgi:hypothetical protein